MPPKMLTPRPLLAGLATAWLAGANARQNFGRKGEVWAGESGT